MTALTLRLEEKLYELLRREAFDRRTTISALIRESITSGSSMLTEDRVLAFLDSSSSARIDRIIMHGQGLLDDRFKDGVFE